MCNTNKTLEEKWATWIICLSIVTFLLCGSAIALWTLKRDVPIVQHKVSFSVDSLGREVYSKSDVDSLIGIVQNQERVLSQKYQYLMEEHSKEDTSKTLITFIVGAIISVCGFFGYKSFKDIKDHGTKIAETKAIDVAKREITERLPELLHQAMTNYYKNESIEVIEQRITQNLNTSFLPYIDALVAEKVEDIKKEVLDELNKQESPSEKEIIEETSTTEIEDGVDSSSLFQ